MMLKNRTLAQVAAAAGVLMLLTGCQSGAASSDTRPGAGVDSKFLDEAQSRVDAAMAEVSSSIPTEGPALATDKFIVLIPCAQAGEGCAQPAEGAKEAAEAAGWRVQIIDGKGTAEGQSAAINQAVSLGADGIVTFAIDPEGVSGALKSARAAGVKVVASSAVDSDAVDFGGIPTEKLWYDSGQMLADYVITETGAESHTIVLTGNEFSALIPRSDGFKDRLAECDSCEVVKEENFAFAEMPTALPRLVQQLVQGSPETDSIYVVYDSAVPFVLQGLESIGRKDITVVSGDATSEALECLRNDCGQSASAALPLRWLGWADIDIMNRLFAGEDPQPAADALVNRLFTTENVQQEPGNWDGDIDYKSIYKKLWNVK